MQMTRGWALVLGICLFVTGIISTISKLITGFRHGFQTPTAVWTSSGFGKPAILALRGHREYVPISQTLGWSIGGTLIGAVVIIVCLWLAKRDRAGNGTEEKSW